MITIVSDPNALLRSARERTPSRRTAGTHMSREELADEVAQWIARRDSRGREVAFDANHLGKIERGVVGRPRKDYVEALCALLNSDEADLGFTTRSIRPDMAIGPAAAQAPAKVALVPATSVSGDADEFAPPEVAVIHAAIPRLRRILDRLDLPDDGPTRTVVDLQGDIIGASDDRVQSRYGRLARRLPDLIAELARAGQLGEAAGRRHAAKFLTLALRAADGIAFKFGYLDLSARLIDAMRSTAQLAEDPLLTAAVAYVRTETFFATGDLDTAARALELAVDHLPTPDTASSSAAFGALHMRAAVVAGRAGKPDRAIDHLHEARRAATVVPEGIYQGTAFGPASLRIHELAVAVELRDATGIERAAAWQPPDELPAERRSHYFIDLARAHLTLGRYENAYLCLQDARRAAPEHTRTHPQVRQSLSTLLRTHNSPSSGLLDLAAWARAR